ncbi:MAG: hypothetical protein FWG66_14255 [Spirochaetes bacterium]|nr:hypothetical protein [Spirochaetota bacterium]
MRRRFFSGIFLALAAAASLSAQQRGFSPQTLRGEVWVELQPILGWHVDESFPLDMPTAGRRALEEAAMLFSAMIYGWSFHYEVGERARQLEEHFELLPVASITFGDPAFRVTEVEHRDTQFRMWADYHLSEAQMRRMRIWQAGSVRHAQARGYYPFAGERGTVSWLELRKAALEDAARVATRAILQGSERNRPREAHGFISLASFPYFFVDRGTQSVSARFRVHITEIVPFAVH